MDGPEFVVAVEFSMVLNLLPTEKLTKEMVIEEVAHRLTNNEFDLESMIDSIKLIEVFGSGERISIEI